MSCDISASKFLGIGVIDPRNILDRCKKEVLLLDIAGVRKKLVTAIERILAVVYAIVEALAFSLI